MAVVEAPSQPWPIRKAALYTVLAKAAGSANTTWANGDDVAASKALAIAIFRPETERLCAPEKADKNGGNETGEKE
jgi:hypothetical protein